MIKVKRLRFWVVTIVLLPLLVPLCLLDMTVSISILLLEWTFERIQMVGWAYCWLHRKLAGNTTDSFRAHLSKRHNF